MVFVGIVCCFVIICLFSNFSSLCHEPCVDIGVHFQHTFNRQPSRWQFHLSLHLLFVQIPWISPHQIWEHKAFLDLSWTCTHTWAFVHGLLDSQENLGAFQSHYGPLIPKLFLLNIQLAYFCPSCYPVLLVGSQEVKQLPLVIFNKCPWEKCFSHCSSYE